MYGQYAQNQGLLEASNADNVDCKVGKSDSPKNRNEVTKKINMVRRMDEKRCPSKVFASDEEARTSVMLKRG